jgi:group I intron endonuclease
MTIYLIYNRANGKYYVGKTIKRLSSRWSDHKSRARTGSPYYLHSAMRRYGFENFEIHPLCTALTSDDELLRWETFFISLLGANNRETGYNLTLGGEGSNGFRHSAETRMKLSKLQKGKPSSATDEGRKLMGEAWKGKKRKPFSPEHRAKIREARERQIISEEHKAKIAASHRGMKRSPEARKRMSEAQRSRPPITEEARRNMSAAQRRRPPISDETRRKRSDSMRRHHEAAA